MSPLIPVDEVIATLLADAVPSRDVQEVSISICVGHVLAEDMVAGINVPPVANSSMDGYAFNCEDAEIAIGSICRISDRIAAGTVGAPLTRGTVARIFTGAPVPEGANAVVMQEDTEPVDDDHIKLIKLPVQGENVRVAGQDIERGALILARGRRIKPQDAALMASVGVAAVPVMRPLRVAVMSTGDELVDPPGPLAPGQIFNSNHYALIGLIRNLGMEVVDLGLVPDDLNSTEVALRRGASQADCIVSSGGVSVGEEDHVKAALEKLGDLALWRIAIKPGKPLAFGQIEGIPFFGLPGNPVSTFVTFTMIARPYLLKMQGCSDLLPRPIYANAAFELEPGGRREYVRVRLETTRDGDLNATAYGNQGSGVMSSVVWADALAEVDIGQSVRYGDRLKVFLIDH
ncbi:MAG: gephyrin-like molybdotransferase Glp [Pseudomonadales bacterium]